jgi:hypothetical protein
MFGGNRLSLCRVTTVTGLFLILAISTTGSAPEPGGSRASKLAKACKKNGGTWLDQYWECEYAPRQWCEASGGRFEECASACRHSPDPATACTMQCVPICSFSDKGANADPK